MHVHSGSLVTLHADQARNAEDLEIRPAGSAPGRKRPNRAAGKPERQAPAAHTQSRRPVRSGLRCSGSLRNAGIGHRGGSAGTGAPGNAVGTYCAGRKHPAPRPSRPSSDCRTQARCDNQAQRRDDEQVCTNTESHRILRVAGRETSQTAIVAAELVQATVDLDLGIHHLKDAEYQHQGGNDHCGRCFLKNVSAAMARTATRTIHPSPPWNRLALYPNADTNGTMQAMIASTPAT